IRDVAARDSRLELLLADERAAADGAGDATRRRSGCARAGGKAPRQRQAAAARHREWRPYAGIGTRARAPGARARRAGDPLPAALPRALDRASDAVRL